MLHSMLQDATTLLTKIADFKPAQGALTVTACFPLIALLVKNYKPRDLFTRHKDKLYEGALEQKEYFRERHLFEILSVKNDGNSLFWKLRITFIFSIISMILVIICAFGLFIYPILSSIFGYAFLYANIWCMRHMLYIRRLIIRYQNYLTMNKEEIPYLRHFAERNWERFLKNRPID